MQPILQIFWKDFRHLWKEVAMTWALLAFLTYLDANRSGYIPVSAEGWLNLLLPLAWCYLTALCVLQDAIPGERQFWLTFPYRRDTLFCAKLLFVAACIHIPYLVSNAVVLEARGFHPWPFVQDLLEKQFFLLFILTLPSLALASIARSATQFVALAILVAAAVILVYGDGDVSAISSQPIPWLNPDAIRRNLALLLLALFSALVLLLQYRTRRTRLSRNLGLAGLLASGALYLWLPPRISATIESSLSRPSPLPVKVRALEPGPKVNANIRFWPSLRSVSIPIDITGLSNQSSDGELSFEPLDVEIETKDGQRFAETVSRRKSPRPGQRPNPPSLFASISEAKDQPGNYRLLLRMEKSIYSRIVSQPVTLNGHFVLERHRASPRLPLSSFGQCAVSFPNGFQDEMLRVTCESPANFPQAQVVLTDTSTGRQWNELLGGSVNTVSYPTNTWLSPVNRREAFFHLTFRDVSPPEMHWQVPASILSHYLLEIEPQPLLGRQVVSYNLSRIELSRY